MLTDMWRVVKDAAVVATGDEGVTGAKRVRWQMRARLHLLAPSCRDAIQLAVQDEVKDNSLT